MFMIQALLSQYQLEYETMIRECNHKQWRELELWKLRMKEKEKEIQDLRQQIALKVNKQL